MYRKKGFLFKKKKFISSQTDFNKWYEKYDYKFQKSEF